MKTNKNTKKLACLGAGCGIVLFAIYGLLPGSFLGGIMGLNISGSLLGAPVSSGILSRLIVAASMITGVMVSCVIFVTAFSTAGWLTGTVAGMLSTDRNHFVTANHK
jgi:hypothetical protein